VAGIATRCKSRILEWRNEVILWRCTDKSVIASRRVRDDHFGKVDMKAVGCLQGDRQLAKFQEEKESSRDVRRCTMHAPMKESPQRRIGMMIRTLVWIKGENDAGRMKLGILMRDKWLCEPVKGCDSEAGDSENARVSWGGCTPY
jgi:hypothetical protein